MIYCIIVTLHLIFDWILQPRKIAKQKGLSNEGLNAVFTHMLINILPFSFIMWIILILMTSKSIPLIIGILSINFISHFLIDLLLPKGKNERQMINYTALDQILHLVILISLITYL
jgi:hypothetical protein